MKFIIVYVIALVVAVLSVNVTESKVPRNFCRGQVRSNGKQIPGGSCSTTIQGKIPSSDNMPSTLIISPENGAVLKPNIKFNVEIAISNIETGHFSDPDTEYYVTPQELNSEGLILGHTHVTIQEINGQSPPDAKEFAFFKGINDKADSQGHLTAEVVSEDGKPGLSPGNYRICTMSGSFSHQPVIMPVAKRGSQDDCIRILISERSEKDDVGKKPVNENK